MKVSLFLIFFAFAISNGVAKEVKETSKKNKSASVENSENSDAVIVNSWKLIAPDNQTFSLYERQTGSKIVNWLSFSRGQNMQRAFPVIKNDWLAWRTKLAQIMENLPKGISCPHALQFKILRNEVVSKEKSVCIETMTQTDQKEIKNLISTWNAYLYGN